ncbi:MAG: HD domain-containing protein [Erysipelotrichaceae bacterium]|nr:HD domain-containing protein [Erysipelotrichaceae bacterium]
MRKLAEEKVFRDPIHGYVRINDQVIWDCLNSREFQRLRRVRQLGSTLMVYSTGEHSRFTHSLGVYEVTRRMVTEVKDLRDNLSEHEKMVVQLAALLHDVGHAPFSHSFESIMKCNHEEYTVQIIRGPSQLWYAMNKEEPGLAEEVASVIDHTHPNEKLTQLISSQLDADRMDYLLRDSYNTGTSYGTFDLERVLRTLRVRDNKVVVKQSGMHTIEDYIMARYHMYWQVYYHPVSRSYDTLLRMVFKRLKDLYEENPDIVREYPMYEALLTKERLSNDDFYLLDDATCIYSFHLMQKGSDPILRDLGRRILERDLFEFSDVRDRDKYYRLCVEKGYNPKYYFDTDHQTQHTYQPYKDNDRHSIWVLTDDNEIKELSSVSLIVRSLSSLPMEQDEKVFFPKEIIL